MQKIFLVPLSECLLLLLAAEQLYNVLVFRSLDMNYFSFANVSIPVYGVSQISNLPTFFMKMMLSSRPTHPVTFTSKCQICQKIDVYNFRYKITVGILMKLFFLTHKCINKKVHKLVHKQIYYIAWSAHITSIPFLDSTLLNCT